MEGNPKNWERWSSAPLPWGRSWPIRNTPLPICVILPNGRHGSSGMSVIKEIPLKKNWPVASRLSRSLRVDHPNRHGSIGYLNDFLLTFHSNLRPISYHFRDKRRFWSKIAKFSTPMYLTPSLNRFSLELVTAGELQKLEWQVYQADKEVWRHI